MKTKIIGMVLNVFVRTFKIFAYYIPFNTETAFEKYVNNIITLRSAVSTIPWLLIGFLLSWSY